MGRLLSLGLALGALLALTLPGARALPLSAGDRVKVTIPEGEEFSGIFGVGLSGELEIPYVRGIPVAGLEPDEVERLIHAALVSQGFFQPDFLRVNVSVVQWAPVEVFVSGATFLPGRVVINEWSDAEQTQPPVQQAGQAPFSRFLSSALRQAGGVTPTADVTAVELQRGSSRRIVDLSGIFTGTPFQDVPLIAGDRVVVPDSGVTNPTIVRPSQITPVGVKIFISNLTVPATGNAVSAIGRDATSFPYGSRFSQAVVSANCAGGTLWGNARRRAILVRTDSLSGETRVLERPVETLLRRSSSDADNPYLMANDAVACYDSGITNLRDVLGLIRDVAVPGALIYEAF